MGQSYDSYCVIDKPQLHKQSCHQCNWYLFSCTGNIEVEVVCPKCRAINYTGTSEPTHLRGSSFQARAIKHYCMKCCRFLFNSTGTGIVEGLCGCGCYTLYDTALMRTPGVHFKIKTSAKVARMQQSLAR